MKTTYFSCLSLGVCCFILFGFTTLQASVWLECPPSVTLNCDADLKDLDKYGKAWIWENYVKKTAPPPVKVVYNTNSCGVGTITRYWEYEDKHWNWHRCSQVITIAGSNTFSAADINWPPSLELEGCNPNADPKYLSKPYNYPTFNNVKCAQPMYSYKDMKFTVSDGCMKILRDWKVIDWCTYVPNKVPQTGVWTYTQIIKIVVKDSAAYIQCPKDTIVDAKNDCKGTYVKLDSVKAFSKCGVITKIRNTSPHSTNKGPDASGQYPIGTTEFYYIAEYGCGVEIKCKVKVTVKNKIPPTPYCLVGINVALMPIDTNRDGIADRGMIEIWAKDFDRGSYHICGYKNLKFSFSSDVNDRVRVFTCDDLGKNTIEMWVTDTFGNQSFCKTMIDIQNNNARIPNCKRKDSVRTGGNTLYIRGKVSRHSGEGIANAQLTLEEEFSVQIVSKSTPIYTTRYDTIITQSGTVFYIKKIDTTFSTSYDTIRSGKIIEKMSNADGDFSFTDIRSGVNYRLIAEKEENNLNGLTVNDAIILLRHIIGSERITSPYQLIAADMNCDGTVNNLDFDLLYGLIIGTISPNAVKIFWKLISKETVLSPQNMSNPAMIPNYVEWKSFNNNQDAADFIAIKLGELDGSTTTFANDHAVTRSTSVGDLLKLANQSTAIQSVNSYPNPFGNEAIRFDLKLINDAPIKIELFDINGKKIFAQEKYRSKGSQTIEIENPSNTAFVMYRISDGSKVFTGKLVR